MLDANAAEEWMQVVCDVAGSVDIGRAGPTALVDQHPVGLLNGLTPEARDLRLDPDARDDEVAGHPEPAGGQGGLDALGAFEPDDLLLASQLDALALVDGEERCAERLAQHLLQRRRLGKDRRDPNPELRQ